jgi:hypothetical protein
MKNIKIQPLLPTFWSQILSPNGYFPFPCPLPIPRASSQVLTRFINGTNKRPMLDADNVRKQDSCILLPSTVFILSLTHVWYGVDTLVILQEGCQHTGQTAAFVTTPTA